MKEGNGKYCIWCGKELTGMQRKYCSSYCYCTYKYRSKHGTRYCKICHKEIMEKGEKYCKKHASQGRAMMDRKRVRNKKRKYIRFLIEYMKAHTYFKAKHIAKAYYLQKELKLYNSRNRDTLIKTLANLYSHYFRLATREGVKYWRGKCNKKGYTYKNSINLIIFFEDFLAGKKMKSMDYKTRKVHPENLEMRFFQDLEKTEILKYKKQVYGKIHFLGSNIHIDSHFRELYEEINQRATTGGISCSETQEIERSNRSSPVIKI